jgi:hypothetical protein
MDAAARAAVGAGDDIFAADDVAEVGKMEGGCFFRS